MITNIPNQAISLSKKDETWRRNTLEAFINKSNQNIGKTSYKQQMIKMYDYYNGRTYSEDYNYILKPYGGAERSNFPAELRTYPLIKPAVDLLIGEKLKRPFNFSCIISNPDIITVKEEAKKQAILENMYQWFVNRLNESGVDTGMESEEIELPEHVEKIFNRNWKDHRALIAQNAIRYLIPYLRWHEKQQKGFFDFLVSGRVVSHRGIYNNDPFYEILNPLEVDYDKDPDIDFIEDGSWVTIRQLASRSSIVDRFHKFLSKENILQLQNPKQTVRDSYHWSHHTGDDNVFNNQWEDYSEVVTVYWQSLKKIGYRRYIDEYGEELTEIVEEGEYQRQDNDIDISWYWINEVWEGYRLDGDIYIDIKPYDIPRTSLENPSKNKLPVNGRTYSDRNSPNISFVLLGIPFQVSYDIFKYRLEAAISRSKDVLALLDINMIPEGWTMDKFMTVLEGTGIAWINYAKEGMQLAPTHKSVLDLSIKTIEQYVVLLNYIKEEWEHISGVTRQRRGEMSQYEGKATSEQSIIQSSHITEDLFRKYAQLEERDLQALIDYSQVAWINGKKAMYIMPDGTPQYLEADEDFTHADIGIFVLDSSKESEKLNQVKSLGQVSLEQGAPLSTVADMINTESFVEMKEKIKDAEELNQQAQEAQKQFEQELQEAQEADKQRERDHEEKLKTMELNNKIRLELIKAGIKTTQDEEWKKELEQQKIQLEEKLKTRGLQEDERSNKASEEIEHKKVAASKRVTV